MCAYVCVRVCVCDIHRKEYHHKANILARRWCIVPGFRFIGGKLSDGDLSCGEMSGGDLSGDELSGGDLSGGELSGGDLSGGELSGGELSGGNLSCSELPGDDLSDDELPAGGVYKGLPAELPAAWWRLVR